MVFGKNPLRHLERCLADAQGFGQATTGAQRLQLILQNSPKFLFAFHVYQPSLSWLTSRVANASAASGSACSSSEAMSLPTKKLVVPITSAGEARTLPLPAVDERIANPHGKTEFRRREHVPAQRARWSADDPGNFPLENGVGLVVARDAIGAVLLELFDHSVGHQHGDARDERPVFESRHRDAVHAAEVVWLNRPEAITGASA